MPDPRLHGRTALVTGAAKRVGRSIALALAREGVNVVLHYSKSEPEARALQAEVNSLGVRAWVVQADLKQDGPAQSLIERAALSAGALDFLINNAATFLPSTLETLRFDDLAESLRVNAWAPFLLCREFARRAQQGAIVNLLDSRIASQDWSHVAYILSKQTLAALTEMMAIRYAPRIRVNGIAPGLILPPPGKDDAYLEQLADTVPLRRHGHPDQIAEATVYLLRSEFVTGQVIYVDGGRRLKEYPYGPNPHP